MTDRFPCLACDILFPYGPPLGKSAPLVDPMEWDRDQWSGPEGAVP